MKFVPVTVNVNAAPPAVADDGEIEVTVGTGLLGGGELPPPPPPPPQAARITAEKAPRENPRTIWNNHILGTTWIAVPDWQACLELVRCARMVMIKVIPFSFCFLRRAVIEPGIAINF
jgi:hypothetical protein